MAHPVAHVFKRGFVCAVVGQHDAIGALVVGLGDRAEAFLARSVPNLHFHVFAVDGHGLNFEVNACDTSRGLVSLHWIDSLTYGRDM